ncbi:hypothetical protein EDD66_104296 [Mobilisporobacter senegalensis]|uniref:Bacterial Ig domain-containing protein n=1 Tax=Mobilisporobacter senegalensis TaxID=1329262 RepID=A0A3N1XUX4_9FIRM|nr:Ig-like domain-containing protein [Mobilisporobacter senegalensis]ROR28707.1 hypothetical protein EDD66_104296 [Mobilisporobacter senegalensis]
MRKILKNFIITAMIVALLMPCVPVITINAETKEVLTEESLNIEKSEGITITLDGKEVTSIKPDEYSNPETKLTEYDVTMPEAGYMDDVFIKIPVKVTEPGYLAFEMNANNVNTMIKGYITNSEGKEAPNFFSIGSFIDSDYYNTSRGSTIFEPGIYNIVFNYVTYAKMKQTFNLNITFTKTEGITLGSGEKLLLPGLDASATFYKVDASKTGGILTVVYTGGTKKYDFGHTFGTITLCDSSKKAIDESKRLSDKGKTVWRLNKGIYYIRMNMQDALYTLEGTLVPYLNTPTIKSTKAKSTNITGTAPKGTTVVITVGKEQYKVKTSSSGKYTLKVKPLAKKAVIKVYAKNNKGQISKTKTVTVK